jgi:hypothetical protein
MTVRRKHYEFEKIIMIIKIIFMKIKDSTILRERER